LGKLGDLIGPQGPLYFYGVEFCEFIKRDLSGLFLVMISRYMDTDFFKMRHDVMSFVAAFGTGLHGAGLWDERDFW